MPPVDSLGVRRTKSVPSRWGRAILDTVNPLSTPLAGWRGLLLLLGAFGAGSAGITAAKDLRYPESGPVAFLLHLPDI